MKELTPDDRPREKLLAHGARALGDNELVALVIGNGGRERDALAIANELLAGRGGLHGLSKSTADELRRAAGVGRAKAVQVMAAIELGRRTLTRAPQHRAQLLAPADTVAFLMPAFGSRPVEQFGLVLLDTKYRVIRTTVVAVGLVWTACRGSAETKTKTEATVVPELVSVSPVAATEQPIARYIRATGTLFDLPAIVITALSGW